MVEEMRVSSTHTQAGKKSILKKPSGDNVDPFGPQVAVKKSQVRRFSVDKSERDGSPSTHTRHVVDVHGATGKKEKRTSNKKTPANGGLAGLLGAGASNKSSGSAGLAAGRAKE